MKKLLLSYALAFLVLPACQSGISSDLGSSVTSETKADSKSNNVNPPPSKSDFRRLFWAVKTPTALEVVYYWSWTEQTSRGIKTYLLVSQIAHDTAILVSSYAGEKAQVEKVKDLDKLEESFPNGNSDGFESFVDLNSIKDWLYRSHYNQVSRCRSSKFWNQIVANDPATRGNFMITRRRVSSFEGAKNYNFTVGLEIDAKTLKIKGLSVVSGSEVTDLRNDQYIGASDDHVVWGGSLTAPLGFSTFDSTCNDQYEKLLNIRAPVVATPPFDSAIDDVASRKLDWELGSWYEPLKGSDYLEQNISDVKTKFDQSRVSDTQDPLYLEIQKKENSNE